MKNKVNQQFRNAINIFKAFRLTLIGRKRQYEGKRTSVWLYIVWDKNIRTKDCKNKKLIR